MNNFRNETLIEFIRKTKPIWYLKSMCIFSILFLLAIFFHSYQSKPEVFWGYALFIFIGLTLQAAFSYWLSYKIYRLGRKAYLQLKDENLQIISDGEVYIKGFDMLSKKSFFNIDLSKTIYDFWKAEFLLSGESMILLGNATQFGGIMFAAPVEITTLIHVTSIAHAKLLYWEDKIDRVLIEIQDEYYSKPIKIEFKNHYDELKPWLNKYGQKKG